MKINNLTSAQEEFERAEPIPSFITGMDSCNTVRRANKIFTPVPSRIINLCLLNKFDQTINIASIITPIHTTQYSPDPPVERYSYNMPHPMMGGDLEPLANYAGQSVGFMAARI